MFGFNQNNINKAALNQLDFQPLEISTKPPQPPSKAGNPQKKNSKTVTDGNKKKNQFAAQQKRIKAEIKQDKLRQVGQATRKQKDIRAKTIQLQKEQNAQIQHLKKLIEKEKQQQQNNDRAFEQKLKQIEKERGDLVKLQKKIQQGGVRNKKQVERQLKALQKQEIPTNDRAKGNQEIRIPQKQGKKTQISQNNQQRHILRQKQLQLLNQQREKCLKNQPTLGYNPTIIPLLSKASYKIISTHISTLVQLFIDDLLEEQVYLLEQIQLKEQKQKQKQKQKDIIHDYYQKISQFVDQAERIESKVGRYQTMKFQDLYIPKHYQKEPYKKKQQSTMLQTCTLTGLDQEASQQIQGRRDRFIRFVGNFDEYKKSNISMFQSVTEQLIDEAIQKLAHELDRGSNDFVEQIFRKQFQ